MNIRQDLSARYSRLVVLLNSNTAVPFAANTFVITANELRQWVVSGKIVRHLFRYQETCLMTCRLAFIMRPFLLTLVLRSTTLGICLIKDEHGNQENITLSRLVGCFFRLLTDAFRKGIMLKHIACQVRECEGELGTTPESMILSPISAPVYLRTDLWFGVSAGGSLGHIAGVLNTLDGCSSKPVFLSTDIIPTVRDDIEKHFILPDKQFWDFAELPSFAFNDKFFCSAVSILSGRNLSFVYQRYSLNNFSGLKLARKVKTPFVLEYNGSEIWIGRHWGKRLKQETLSERIEMLNLNAADLIVVVSGPMKDELMARGINKSKILVNPNGVDPDRYSPKIDGSRVRSRYGLDGKTVVGFIGTFGPWHGAEVLADAFGILLRAYPEKRDSLRLLMIGDGIKMTEVKKAMSHHGIAEAVVLTGLVPQEEGPAHLAACDILASPHVPNSDGTPFFGSPTKLFEYMAMGKAIVASDLDQIGEVLEHDRTAWMVKPGDAEALASGLKVLIADPERRARLGAAARLEAVSKHTWKEHTRRIIEKLQECISNRESGCDG